jgi:hypothetical protein
MYRRMEEFKEEAKDWNYNCDYIEESPFRSYDDIILPFSRKLCVMDLKEHSFSQQMHRPPSYPLTRELRGSTIRLHLPHQTSKWRLVKHKHSFDASTPPHTQDNDALTSPVARRKTQSRARSDRHFVRDSNTPGTSTPSSTTAM